MCKFLQAEKMMEGVKVWKHAVLVTQSYCWCQQACIGVSYLIYTTKSLKQYLHNVQYKYTGLYDICKLRTKPYLHYNYIIMYSTS